MGNPYFNIIHPRWRYTKWEDITPSDRQEVEDGIRGILKMFPREIQDNIIDIELIGSFAFGTADIFSDLDITFVPKNELVDKYRNMWIGGGKRNFPEIVNVWFDLTNKLCIHIEIAFGLSAKNTCCYSFNEKKFYGKQWGEVLNKRCKYDFTTKQYELVAGNRLLRRFAYEVDLWQV